MLWSEAYAKIQLCYVFFKKYLYQYFLIPCAFWNIATLESKEVKFPP